MEFFWESGCGDLRANSPLEIWVVRRGTVHQKRGYCIRVWKVVKGVGTFEDKTYASDLSIMVKFWMLLLNVDLCMNLKLLILLQL